MQELEANKTGNNHKWNSSIRCRSMEMICQTGMEKVRYTNIQKQQTYVCGEQKAVVDS